jgi:uncharacterized membrane protein
MDELIFALKIIAALGCGLIAGAFFAFSSFVMKALGQLPPANGISAMQSINVVVINPVFLGVFVGTVFICLAAMVLALVRWQGGASMWVLAGGVLYIAGCFLVTMLLNVPLNDAIAKANPTSPEGEALWTTYLDKWTMWNTVRTIASLAASAAFMIAMRY